MVTDIVKDQQEKPIAQEKEEVEVDRTQSFQPLSSREKETIKEGIEDNGPRKVRAQRTHSVHS